MVDGPAAVVDFVPSARIIVAVRGLHAEHAAEAVTKARRVRGVPLVVRRLHDVRSLCAWTRQSRVGRVGSGTTYVIAGGDDLGLAVVPRVRARGGMRAAVGAVAMRGVAAVVARGAGRAVVGVARARAAGAAVAVMVRGARGVDGGVVLGRTRLRVLSVAVRRGVVDLGLRGLDVGHGVGAGALVAVAGHVVRGHGCVLECGGGKDGLCGGQRGVYEGGGSAVDVLGLEEGGVGNGRRKVGGHPGQRI